MKVYATILLVVLFGINTGNSQPTIQSAKDTSALQSETKIQQEFIEQLKNDPIPYK